MRWGDRMPEPQVVMLSFWRDDSARRLEERAAHLLAKTYPALRYVWVVGDSDDDTAARLARVVQASARDVTLLTIRTYIPDRFERLSETASVGLDCVSAADAYVVIHESDIVSPPDVVERLVAHAQAGRCPIGAWPVLTIPGHATLFYDIWAVHKDGQNFANYPPYHPAYVPDRAFEVDGLGTLWLMDAADIRRGVRAYRAAARELCAALKARGRRLWIDPTLAVEQPFDLWHFHNTETAPS